MTGSRGFRILVILAGIMGADGVILAAAAAHQGDAARLGPASSMLLFHAIAVLAAVALTERGIVYAKGGVAAAARAGTDSRELEQITDFIKTRSY